MGREIGCFVAPGLTVRYRLEEPEIIESVTMRQVVLFRLGERAPPEWLGVIRDYAFEDKMKRTELQAFLDREVADGAGKVVMGEFDRLEGEIRVAGARLAEILEMRHVSSAAFVELCEICKACLLAAAEAGAGAEKIVGLAERVRALSESVRGG